MNPDFTLSSLQNSRVKQVLSLRDRRCREESGNFLIEGYRELLRASDANWKVELLFVCPALFLGCNEEALIQRLVAKGAKRLDCTEQVFHKISYRDRPDGLLAVAPQVPLTLKDLALFPSKNSQPLFIVAEAIEKPGNLGTIMRSADSVGADGIIICDRCTDIFNPNVVRASVGTLFTIPVIQATSQETLPWLKAHGITILAATPSAKEEYTEVNMNVPLAIAVGTEQLGLSQFWLDGASLQVRIPMMGVADSLNVAMATTLLMYEALRQRNFGGNRPLA